MMTDNDRKKIETWLNAFPEVEWDRLSGKYDRFCIFGWIKRDDGKLDFLMLIFDDCAPSIFSTPSAKYSAEFSKRLGMGGEHHDCLPVKIFFNVKTVRW